MGEENSRRLLRAWGQSLLIAYKAILYFFSFLLPLLLLNHFRSAHPAILLALALFGFGMAGFTFLSLLILTKKLAIGRLEPTGIETIHTAAGKRFFSASMLHALVETSPFRSFVAGLSPFASWYFRGMGAKMPASVYISMRARISDPWFLEMGKDVSVGGDALILGHLGHGQEIILGKVIIGDGAVVGAKSIIFPDVRIGRHARVGAGAVVTRGTIIADGETWAGVPARKLSTKSRAAQAG